jgi:hypothetical protein
MPIAPPNQAPVTTAALALASFSHSPRGLALAPVAERGAGRVALNAGSSVGHLSEDVRGPDLYNMVPCVHSAAGLQRIRLGAVERYGALRDFKPGYVGSGSFSTQLAEATSLSLSAAPPIATVSSMTWLPSQSAISGCEHRSKASPYSITSSAATSRPGGTVKPSDLAVLRLTIVSNLVAACTGRSAGLSPRRMRST